MDDVVGHVCYKWHGGDAFCSNDVQSARSDAQGGTGGIRSSWGLGGEWRHGAAWPKRRAGPRRAQELSLLSLCAFLWAGCALRVLGRAQGLSLFLAGCYEAACLTGAASPMRQSVGMVVFTL